MISKIARALLGAALLAIAAAAATAAPAAKEAVTVYAAGSLRGLLGALSTDPGARGGIDLKPTFGGAGMLRDKIEAGAKPDLFLSADMASPRKLAAEGRTLLPPVAFARNRMCLYARQGFNITAADLVPRLLAKDTRIRTSTPGADPNGAYAVAIFDRIDKLHPGAGRVLRDKAQALRTALKGQPPSAIAAEFENKQIDVMIAYCSARAMLEKRVPRLAAIPFPPQLDPGPVFGLAVLSSRPAALRLALFLLSEPGQRLLQSAGLIPLSQVSP